MSFVSSFLFGKTPAATDETATTVAPSNPAKLTVPAVTATNNGSIDTEPFDLVADALTAEADEFEIKEVPKGLQLLSAHLQDNFETTDEEVKRRGIRDPEPMTDRRATGLAKNVYIFMKYKYNRLGLKHPLYEADYKIEPADLDKYFADHAKEWKRKPIRPDEQCVFVHPPAVSAGDIDEDLWGSTEV